MGEKNNLNLTPTRQSLPISLLRTREMFMDFIRPILKRHNITEQQWRVLRVVGEGDGPVDPTTIAYRACLLAPSLTRILKTLTKRGFVETINDPHDGRRVLVKLTKSGHSFVKGVAPESAKVFKELREIVGEKNWKELVKLLIEVREYINIATAQKNNKNN